MLRYMYDSLSKFWNLPQFGYFLWLDQATAYAQLLTLINFSAKVVDYSFYDIKDEVMEFLVLNSFPFISFNEGVMYIEGEKQFSFHSPNGDYFQKKWEEIVGNPVRSQWDGVRKQFLIPEIIWGVYFLNKEEFFGET